MELATILDLVGQRQVKGDINPKVVRLILNAIVPEADSELFTRLHSLVVKLHGEMKNRGDTVTVGQLIGHPDVIAFFGSQGIVAQEGPNWRLLKCPTCDRVIQRDTHNPANCMCGYDWAAEREPLARIGRSERAPIVSTLNDALRKIEKV
jgi:hypothetical protein